MVVQLVVCVGRRFQLLKGRRKNESLWLVVAQVDCLKRCEPLVLVSFSWSTSVATRDLDSMMLYHLDGEERAGCFA